MSDTGHHEHEVVGHEIDKMPNRRLFNLLFGLSALTLVACIGVIQLFNLQVTDIEDGRARMGSFQLAEYRAEMALVAAGRGTIEVREYDGKESPRTYIPIADAKKQLLENPQLLKARPPYAAWKNTDTFQALEQVRQKAAADAARRPPEPEPEPEEGAGAPEGDAPGEPEGDAPGEEPEGEDKGPAEGKPTQPDPAGDDSEKPRDEPAKPKKPAGDEPAPSDSGNDSEGGN